MLVADIIAKVKEAIEDDSFTDDQIVGYINKGIGRVATLPVPELMVENSVVVAAGTRVVVLPDDFFSNLLWAYNITTELNIEVVGTYADFLMRFPKRFDSGNIARVCVRKPHLYVHPIPKVDEILLLTYTSKPEELSSGDEVEVIEETFQEDLLMSFATAECYSLIENGIEGTKVNYNKWMGNFNLAKEEYALFLGLAEETADFVPDPEKDFRDSEPWV